jgi:hypothetical protein
MSIIFNFKDEVNTSTRNDLCKIQNCPNKNKCKKLTCKYCKKYGHGISCCLKLLRKKNKQKNKQNNNQVENYTLYDNLHNTFLPVEKEQMFYSMMKNQKGNYPISVSHTKNQYASHETNINRHNHQTKVIMSVSETTTIKYEKKRW